MYVMYIIMYNNIICVIYIYSCISYYVNYLLIVFNTLPFFPFSILFGTCRSSQTSTSTSSHMTPTVTPTPTITKARSKLSQNPFLHTFFAVNLLPQSTQRVSQYKRLTSFSFCCNCSAVSGFIS